MSVAVWKFFSAYVIVVINLSIYCYAFTYIESAVNKKQKQKAKRLY